MEKKTKRKEKQKTPTWSRGCRPRATRRLRLTDWLTDSFGLLQPPHLHQHTYIRPGIQHSPPPPPFRSGEPFVSSSIPEPTQRGPRVPLLLHLLVPRRFGRFRPNIIPLCISIHEICIRVLYTCVCVWESLPNS